MRAVMRPYRLSVLALLIAAGALTAPAQISRVVQMVTDPSPLLHASSEGYLGVYLADVDQEKAQQLRLKDVRGAVITLIDHDAPAGQAGLKVNDVVLKLNGQAVEGAEQLRRMLREIPAGRKVSLVISRDGNVQTLAVELADRQAMEKEIWRKIGTGGDLVTPAPGMGILGGGGDVPAGTPGFHMPFFGSTLNVGALVEPLTSQMAEYLGVPSGLMIKQVARKSEAAAAGLKAFDVILKVGGDSISTVADWDRALRANQGKSVQVTVLRERKQQTVTMQVDSKHHGAVIFEDLFPGGDPGIVATLEAEVLHFEPAPEQLREFAEQMEHFQATMPQDFDQKVIEQTQREMEQLKQQLEEMKALGFGDHI